MKIKHGTLKLLLAALLLGLINAGSLAEEDDPTAYTSIRVVREASGEPSRPMIELPEGYELHTEGDYEIKSRGEYYVFLKGPEGVAEDVRIRWPGVPIRAVIHRNTHLQLDHEADDHIIADIPVDAESLRAAWPSLEVHTHYHEPGRLMIRIEHNHPDRAAGYYAERDWVAGQAQAALNFIYASRQIMRDWGIHRQISDDEAGRIALMGFESNNPLHGDDPAHWHWIYYWPTHEGSQVPHFYMEDDGRVTSNAHDVFGDGRTMLGPGEPAVYTDPQGEVRFVITIRDDGGVNIGPAVDDDTYAIVAGDEGDFVQGVQVLREGEPWLHIACEDDVDEGVLTVRIDTLDDEHESATETYLYDPLTGAPRQE